MNDDSELEVFGVTEGNRDVDHKYAHFGMKKCNMYAYDIDIPATRIIAKNLYSK